jgi:hypothetical protein
LPASASCAKILSPGVMAEWSGTPGPPKKGSGFKPKSVQVKALQVLCHWSWLGGTNGLSVRSAVVLPKKIKKCWAKPACFLSAWFCGFVLLQWKHAGLQQKFGQAYGANTGALCRRIRAGELHIHKSLLGYRRRLHISDELLPSMPTTFSYTGTRRPLRPQPSHHLAPVQGGWFANLPRWLLVLRQAFAKFFHRQRRRLLWGTKSVFCLSVSLTRTMCFKLPRFLNPKILKNQNPVPSFFLNPKILETQKPTSKLLVKPYNSGNPKTHFQASC